MDSSDSTDKFSKISQISPVSDAAGEVHRSEQPSGASQTAPKIVWSDDEFAIGIQIIDEQHKRLVALINELHFAAEAERPAPEMWVIIEELENYVRTHFTVEEEFMRLFHYPGYDHHRRAHSEFEDIVKKVRDNTVTPAELCDLLTSWLMTHVVMSDQDLGQYLTSLGVR